MIVMKRAAVLRETIQLPSQRAPSASIYTMAMRRAHNIRPRLMDSRMDHIRRGIQQPVLSASDHFPCMVDEDEVGLVHEAERAAEGIHPEAVGLYGIAEGDVACDTLVVAVFAEDAEGGCEAAFEVFALLVLVFEGRWPDGLRAGQSMQLNIWKGNAYFGKEIIFPCAMFFLIPGSRGAWPGFTDTPSPFNATPVALSSACGAIVVVRSIKLYAS